MLGTQEPEKALAGKGAKQLGFISRPCSMSIIAEQSVDMKPAVTWALLAQHTCTKAGSSAWAAAGDMKSIILPWPPSFSLSPASLIACECMPICHS